VRSAFFSDRREALGETADGPRARHERLIEPMIG
jgi:hypothetical protein